MGTELTPTGIEYLVMSIVYIIVMIVTVFDLVILFLNSIAPITDDGGRSGSQRKHKHVFVIRLHVVFRLFLLISLGARVVMMLLRVAWDPSGKSVADVALSRTTTTFSFTAFAMVVLSPYRPLSSVLFIVRVQHGTTSPGSPIPVRPPFCESSSSGRSSFSSLSSGCFSLSGSGAIAQRTAISSLISRWSG